MRTKDAIVQIRACQDDVDRWRVAADRADMSLSDWLRRAAKKALQEIERP